MNASPPIGSKQRTPRDSGKKWSSWVFAAIALCWPPFFGVRGLGCAACTIVALATVSAGLELAFPYKLSLRGNRRRQVSKSALMGTLWVMSFTCSLLHSRWEWGPAIYLEEFASRKSWFTRSN